MVELSRQSLEEMVRLLERELLAGVPRSYYVGDSTASMSWIPSIFTVCRIKLKSIQRRPGARGRKSTLSWRARV
jgi:hypothetical protein